MPDGGSPRNQAAAAENADTRETARVRENEGQACRQRSEQVAVYPVHDMKSVKTNGEIANDRTHLLGEQSDQLQRQPPELILFDQLKPDKGDRKREGVRGRRRGGGSREWTKGWND